MKMKVNFAVIGGTGVYNPKMLSHIEELVIETTYGDVLIKIGKLGEKRVAFLARHGSKHSVPPHVVSYRANILALKKLGVKKIIATAAVGSINKSMAPGDFILVDQFIDFTKGRIQTFYEGGEQGVLHVDMTEPYCKKLCKVIADNCPSEINLYKSGTYVCTEGPRFETPAEIKMFAGWGGDLVGMTGVPEVVLARELGMCYASIAMVTNYAAGISQNPLTHQEVIETMAQNKNNLQKLIMNTLAVIDDKQECLCPLANREAGNLA